MVLVTNINQRFKTGDINVETSQEKTDLVEALDYLISRQTAKLARIDENAKSFKKESEKLTRFQEARTIINTATIGNIYNIIRQHLWDLVLALQEKIGIMERDGTSVSQAAKFARMQTLFNTIQGYNFDFHRERVKPFAGLEK